MSSLRLDLRYALRGLVRSPGFTAIVVVTMAVGIGANATVFSFVDALLTRTPPGLRAPRSLVSVFTSDYSSGAYGTTSYPDYLSLRDDAGVFAELAAWHGDTVAVLQAGDDADRVRVGEASGDLFAVLGLVPQRGRLLTPEDARPDAPPAAVISDRSWRRLFDGASRAVGRTISLNGRAFTIVGVLPPRFDGLAFGDVADVWTALVPPPASPEERGNRGYRLIGRLRAGVSRDQAQIHLDALAHKLATQFPVTNRGTLARPDDPRPFAFVQYARVDPEFRSDLGWLGAVMIGATALVLAIACANVAGLMLSRATGRGREMAVRLALGASQSRLVRQLLVEGMVFGLTGGAFGVLFALWTAGALPSFLPPEIAELLNAQVDARTLGFTALVSIAAGLLLGLVPTWHARRPSTAAALRTQTGAVMDSGRASRARSVFVIAQVALSCVLLIVTGLLVQSLGNTLGADLGFGARRIAIHVVEVPATEFGESLRSTYYSDALRAVASIPGVESTAWVKTLSLDPGPRRRFRFDQYEPRPGEDMELHVNTISTAYFDTMQIPIVAGRAFTPADRPGAPLVAIVNDILAQRFFGGAAVGRRLRDSLDRELEIVGVVRAGTLRTPQESPAAMVYYPLGQDDQTQMTLVSRTAKEPATLLEPIRLKLRDTSRRVAVARMLTMETHLSEVFADDRIAASLVATCGVMALLLALVGVYGVMAFAVISRTREIGLRLALGASPWQVVGVLVRDGLWLTGIGVALGLGASAVSTRVVQSMLHGISTLDPLTFVAVPVVLGIVAMAAALVPARRALRIDPSTVLLKQE